MQKPQTKNGQRAAQCRPVSFPVRNGSTTGSITTGSLSAGSFNCPLSDAPTIERELYEHLAHGPPRRHGQGAGHAVADVRQHPSICGEVPLDQICRSWTDLVRMGGPLALTADDALKVQLIISLATRSQPTPVPSLLRRRQAVSMPYTPKLSR
jgi:hypothetical protein